MSKVKIAIRVDASITMGSGHVMRCLTLADQLVKRGCDCVFITRRQPGDLNLMISEKGYDVHVLRKQARETEQAFEGPQSVHTAWLDCSWQVDAKQTRDVLLEVKPDLIIVDHYALSKDWETAVNPDSLKLMVIDDLADREHRCSMLLDQNFCRSIEDYANLVPDSCKCLIGPEYALLRPEFEEARESSLSRRVKFNIENILVSMGGVDKDNATASVLDILDSCELPKSCAINVVMGFHSPWLNQVKERAEKMQYTTEVLVGIGDMAARMADADLSIGAVGGTTWERCALGLPAFVMLLAENQRVNVDSLVQIGAIQYFDFTSFSSFLENYPALELRNMSTVSASLCQGNGAERVADCLLFNIKGATLTNSLPGRAT
jgi:UDP-2,4-diacetamido-2,4,6-trideoxy-beta-L-altropyranose hydrolase